MLLIKGVSDVGGLGIVWERNYNSSRIELFKYYLLSVPIYSNYYIVFLTVSIFIFSIDTDPTTPHTVIHLKNMRP
jgi:hypothetical protein